LELFGFEDLRISKLAYGMLDDLERELSIAKTRERERKKESESKLIFLVTYCNHTTQRAMHTIVPRATWNRTNESGKTKTQSDSLGGT
jgi:hypothetical protein